MPDFILVLVAWLGLVISLIAQLEQAREIKRLRGRLAQYEEPDAREKHTASKSKAKRWLIWPLKP